MEPIFELDNILKIYPNGVVACNKACLKVNRKTIHAIVGENGAGKTTLMKIITGFEIPQEGEIFYKGKRVNIKNPNDAIKIGIGMVHQHFMLVPNLTVAENLVLGIEPGRCGFLNMEEIIQVTKKISEQYGLEVPVNKKVIDVPMGIRQRVEILKALLKNSEVLILDEPTSMLTPQETEQLFTNIKELKSLGKTIIFISHKLKEVKAVADEISIMRRGKVIYSGNIKNLSERKIAHLMVGRDIHTEREEEPERIGEQILNIENLTYVDKEGRLILDSTTFNLRKGEILGIVGVDGNGQDEIVQIIMGLLKIYDGKVEILGENIRNKSPRDIMEMKVSCIPKDKFRYGIAQEASLLENIIINKYYKKLFRRGPIVNKAYINNYIDKIIDSFSIAASETGASINSLSGGNIQKVIIARALTSDNNIIIAHEPTQGLDIGAAEMVHSLMVKCRDKGTGVLLISSDLDELLKLSSRIVVLYNGRIVARFDDIKKITPKDIGPYMLGVKAEKELVKQ